MTISEKQIEDFLDECVRPRGGVAVKLGHSGWHDRIILLPGARMGLLEVKRPGEEPDPLQWERIATARALGFHSGFADTYAGVEAFVKLVSQERL